MASFVGIDIGSVAVKVAVLRTAYRKLQLVGLACVDLAQAPSPEEAVKMAVGLATGGRGAESISTALDGARGAVRVVTLPASDPASGIASPRNAAPSATAPAVLPSRTSLMSS